MIGRHRVFQRVLARAAADAHHKAGGVISEGDVLARLEIFAVAHGARQIAAHILDRREREHIAHEIRRSRDIGLHAVEERVKTLVGGELRRYGDHQLRVDDSQYGEERIIEDCALFVHLLVRDDAARVRLGTGAGGRRDGHDRQRPVHKRTAQTAAGVDIIPEVALVHRHRGDTLRGVHRAAAAERDDKITAVLTRRRRARHHGRTQRIRLHPVKERPFHARELQLVLQPREIAVGLRRLSV